MRFAVEPTAECSANIGRRPHQRETWDGPCEVCGRSLLPDRCKVHGTPMAEENEAWACWECED